jgi:hypothetical protein
MTVEKVFKQEGRFCRVALESLTFLSTMKEKSAVAAGEKAIQDIMISLIIPYGRMKA